MVTLKLNGYKFYYKKYKSSAPSRSPVFIFNGIMQNTNTWKKYIKYFIDSSDVILADLPGAGKADTIKTTEFNLEELADYANFIVEDVKTDKIDIISASYGSGIAYAFSKKFPGKVNHLFIAGTVSKLNSKLKKKIEKSIEYLKSKKMESFANQIVEILLNKKFNDRIGKFDVVERLVNSQFRKLSYDESEKYIINANHLLKHPEINVALSPKIKKLVITGEYDILSELNEVRNVASKLTNCRFTTIKNADHLFHLEQLEVTLNLIREFFRDRPLETVHGINPIECY